MIHQRDQSNALIPSSYKIVIIIFTHPSFKAAVTGYLAWIQKFLMVTCRYVYALSMTLKAVHNQIKHEVWKKLLKLFNNVYYFSFLFVCFFTFFCLACQSYWCMCDFEKHITFISIAHNFPSSFRSISPSWKRGLKGPFLVRVRNLFVTTFAVCWVFLFFSTFIAGCLFLKLRDAHR